MITTTELADRLHDIDTHAAAWSRILRDRADRPGTSATDLAGLRTAAADIEGAAKSFRWRAAQPDTDPFGLLRVADRALRHASTLQGVLERERDAVMTASPEEAGWFAHELSALQKVRSARRDLIALPNPGETPAEELEAIKIFSALLGREIQIDFEGAEGAQASLDVTLGLKTDQLPAGVELEAAARIARLADRLIRCDIPNWDQGPGASGRVRIGPDEDPWLDAVDNAEDWLLERTVDLDALAEMRWEAGDTSPEP